MRLRLKLVLLVLGLTTVLLGGLGLAVIGSLRGWTDEVVDAELARRADVLVHEAHFDEGHLELDDDDDLATRGLPFRIERENGSVLLGSDDWPSASLTGLGAISTRTRSGEPVRVLSVKFTPRHGREPLVLRVASSLGPVSGVAHKFREGLLYAVILAAVLSALGAALLATWFLAPLHRLSGAVDALEAKAITGRLETRGLEPALGRLAEAFNGLLDRIASGLRGQREFVGRASHALRTPLASILTEAEVALRQERSPEKYRATLESIIVTTKEAARLTDGLLALTRADAAANSVAREEVVLVELAGELQHLFSARAEAGGLTLACSAPPGLVVKVTRARLREVLDALLDNAVRYTPRGGTVRFEARAEGPGVVLEVVDSGPGFKPEERTLVFERFFRGSAAESTGQPGSGLGLAVVKALVEAEGGVVSVGEGDGGGARVRVSFVPAP